MHEFAPITPMWQEKTAHRFRISPDGGVCDGCWMLLESAPTTPCNVRRPRMNGDDDERQTSHDYKFA